ncbi:MAG: hypothetical protein QOE11_1001 [Solirubrobacteraceae bacterium]|nr:hypothetical protein [Solirubrobacteraceae bacterium]
MTAPAGAIGARLRRSDGRAKVTGAFAYSSDLRADGMLHGATVRSPHAHALIAAIDTSAAASLPGVRAVLVAGDVPGDRLVGSVLADQPVLAFERVRHHGEPVAIVAAEDPRTAARAAALVDVAYEPLTALTTVQAALAGGAPALHPGGNELRTVRVLHGDPAAHGPVVVRATYEVGTQDQAFLGPESGLAIPDADGGGVELHVATQWLHVDRDQVAAGLGLDPERVRVVLAGVGGAFGAREDLSMQLHACLLALRTRRPVRMAYGREESFLGHVHRHPARMEYEHVADEQGVLIAVRARLWLDGGAYASSSTAVIANATTLAAGPYAVPSARLEGTVAYTNNPPNGAMRGFGAVQVAFAYESQMDRLARAVGLDPLELRRRNELRSGDVLPFGQAIRGPVAVSRLLGELAARPLPPRADDPRALPGGAFGATGGEGVVRGVGYAAGFKNIAFSEGFDDPTTARVRLVPDAGGGARAEVHTAAAEVGQGVAGVQEQVVRTELGVQDVRILMADTSIATAGSASASRLTWMVCGAVRETCRAIAELVGGRSLEEALAGGPLEAERTYRHRRTHPIDPQTGQGAAHVAFAFAAHRAVVDVDAETGLARVVELTCAQDVGRAVNPLALEGQLEGAGVQGLGLALTEQLIVDDGLVQTRSFGEYRIPTMADAPALPTVILELGDPDGPYGVKGAGEIPATSATPAVVAALRAATGAALERVPVRPEDLVCTR